MRKIKFRDANFVWGKRDPPGGEGGGQIRKHVKYKIPKSNAIKRFSI